MSLIQVPAIGSMRALQADAFSIDALSLVQKRIPHPRRGEVLVQLRAASLNYRDLAVLTANLLPKLVPPYVPASDGCGVVVELGDGVTRLRVGDRVMPTFTQGWHDGLPTPEQRTGRTLGAPLDGVLQEYIAVPAEDAVIAPESLSDAEAATLPIAALTAWSTLVEGGLKSGDTVLVQGTGGVALFALQFAKAAGATVIATSSSDDKLMRLKSMGADVGINYHNATNWAEEVKAATRGRGADIVVETGGSTLPQSLAAAAFGGFVGVVGYVAGFEATIAVRQILVPMLRVQGIAIGSRVRFEAMNRGIEANAIKPVIDSRFNLAQGADAFRHMAQGAHFGKVVIEI